MIDARAAARPEPEQVLVDIALRVNHHRFAGFLAADKVGIVRQRWIVDLS